MSVSRIQHYLSSSSEDSEDRKGSPTLPSDSSVVEEDNEEDDDDEDDDDDDDEEVVVENEMKEMEIGEDRVEDASKTKKDSKTEAEKTAEARNRLLLQLLSIQSQLDSMKSEILKEVKAIQLPCNPLDELIDQLGGESKVAEMTGRMYRVLRHHPGIPDSSTAYFRSEKEASNPSQPLSDSDLRLNDSYFYCQSRGIKRGSGEGINMREKQSFQSGEKLIAIISEAASAGISLQSDRRVANQRKRIHIILELPWSADKVIQQCGRSHRSNQSVSPDYVFLLSAIGGEIRFTSTISARLRALGALTQGSRNATGALDFSQFDLDSQYGRKAVRIFLNAVLDPEDAEYLPDDYGVKVELGKTEKAEYAEYAAANGEERLQLMGKWLRSVGIQDEKESSAMLFNRMLGLEIFKQQQLVQFLMEVGMRSAVHRRSSRRKRIASRRPRCWTRASTSSPANPSSSRVLRRSSTRTPSPACRACIIKSSSRAACPTTSCASSTKTGTLLRSLFTQSILRRKHPQARHLRLPRLPSALPMEARHASPRHPPRHRRRAQRLAVPRRQRQILRDQRRQIALDAPVAALPARLRSRRELPPQPLRGRQGLPDHSSHLRAVRRALGISQGLRPPRKNTPIGPGRTHRARPHRGNGETGWRNGETEWGNREIREIREGDGGGEPKWRNRETEWRTGETEWRNREIHGGGETQCEIGEAYWRNRETGGRFCEEGRCSRGSWLGEGGNAADGGSDSAGQDRNASQQAAGDEGGLGERG